MMIKRVSLWLLAGHSAQLFLLLMRNSRVKFIA